MNFISKIKDAVARRRAKRQRRAEMSFNSSGGGGSGKRWRAEAPGSRHSGVDQNF